MNLKDHAKQPREVFSFTAPEEVVLGWLNERGVRIFDVWRCDCQLHCDLAVYYGWGHGARGSQMSHALWAIAPTVLIAANSADEVRTALKQFGAKVRLVGITEEDGIADAVANLFDGSGFRTPPPASAAALTAKLKSMFPRPRVVEA